MTSGDNIPKATLTGAEMQHKASAHAAAPNLQRTPCGTTMRDILGRRCGGGEGVDSRICLFGSFLQIFDRFRLSTPV